jgi:hypothetical protein
MNNDYSLSEVSDFGRLKLVVCDYRLKKQTITIDDLIYSGIIGCT